MTKTVTMRIVTIIIAIMIVTTIGVVVAIEHSPTDVTYADPGTGHTHDAITFTEWTSNGSLPTAAGSYYLTQDVILFDSWDVPAGTTNLCLNGHAINLNGFYVTVDSGATLNLYDCGAATRYITTNANGVFASVSDTTSEGAVEVTGGFIAGTTSYSIRIMSGGTFNMYSGSLCCNAFGVYVNGSSHDASFTMYGGSICHNKIGVYVSNGTFTMEDGSISHNVFKASTNSNGAGVQVKDTFIMNGGSIEYNIAEAHETYGNTGYGGGVLINISTAGGYVEMNGGTISHNEAKYGAGVYIANKGEFVMNDGAISYNEAEYGGGVRSEGTFIMNDGTISYNEAEYGGGGFYNDCGTLNIKGGEIRNNNTTYYYYSSGAGVFTNVDIALSGNPVIKDNTWITDNSADNLYLNTDCVVNLDNSDPLTTGADIGIMMDTPGVFTNNVGESFINYFSSDSYLYYVDSNDDHQLELALAHAHDETAFTTKWTSNSSLPTEAGSYYLTQDVTMTSSWPVDNCTINLCLNGHGIVFTESSYVIIMNDGTLNLYDCGTATRYITTNANGVFASVSDTTSEGAIEVTGGFIAGSTTYAVQTSAGTFNMYGGTVCCNESGVLVSDTQTNTFTMYGGAISYNQMGVKVNQGTFTMEDGTISHNEAKALYLTEGAGVQVYDTFIMNGGTISDNSARIVGGGLYISIDKDGGHVEMNGGAILNNQASSFGGGVYIIEGTFVMNNGLIRGNSAYAGGGVCNMTNGTFTMNGGTIRQNTSEERGGGIHNAATFTMNGGMFKQNHSGMGGAISTGGVFTLTAGSITENVAAYGAGILFGNGEFHISGAPTISGNVDSNDAPTNIYILNESNPVYIMIDDALTNTTPLGVNMHTLGKFTNDDVAAYKDNFTPDDTAHIIKTTAENALTLEIAHIHVLSYTVNGATITATCSADECPLEDNKATLTINAPTGSLVYDGTAKVATLSDYNNSVFAPEAIKYYNGGQEVLSCINAGTYVAKVTSNGKTAEVEFVIAKADLAESDYTIPTGLEAVYGDDLADVDLPEGWAWVTPSDKVGNVGNRQHNATFTPEDSVNYNGVTKQLTVAVAKAIPDCTVPTGLTSLVDMTLDTVALPAGWTWNAPETNVGDEVGAKTFKATFTPEDTDNYEIVKNVDVEVNVSTHQHAFTYTANGATITAVCGSEGCYITEGLTLTLVAPAGDMVYDGHERVATFAAGYNAEAFPNAAIVYYKDGQVVASCINAGAYIAKVTFGEATAQVEFVIENWSIADDDNGVVVEIEGAEVDENIEIEVEVRTSVASEQSEVDYTDVVASKLEQNEEVFIVYDVKLIQITIVDGQEVRTEIQPSDIKPGATILVVMDIPQELRGKDIKVLHVHSENDVEFVNDYQIGEDGATLTIRTNRLSVFAFIAAKVAPAPNGLGGGAIAGIVIACLLVVGCILFFLLWFLLKNVWLVVDGKVVRAIRLSYKYGDQSKFLTITCKCVRRDKPEVFESKDAAEEWLKNNQPEAPAEEPKAEEAPIEEPKDSADESND